MGIRTVLVDDVPEVRRLVRTALRFRGGFDVVGEAADGTAAVALTTTLQPDLVVLDLGLPDLAGREVLTRIRRGSPRSGVVVFSGIEAADRDWIAEQVEGYVLKDADLDYLVNLLESVGRRRDDGYATLDLSREPTSTRQARRFVWRALTGWGTEYLLDDALVVVSELVTNAITHAASRCQLRLSLQSGSVRIEVVDKGFGTPDPQAESSVEEHGRGLHLVAALSAAWGIDLDGDSGKVVWAELPRTG